METLVKYGIGVVAVVALVFGFIAYNRQPVETPPVGAVSGANDTYVCKNSNGVATCKVGKTLTTATTTVCAIQGPNATSTLLSASIRESVSTTTASVLTIAKATTAFATTTLLGNQVAYAAGAQVAQVATSTTLNQTSTDFTFAPNAWVVFGMQGNPGTFSPTGGCNATFEVMGNPNFNY